MIKFIYFDVGGVLVKDFSGTNKWEEMKRDIGITKAQDEEFDSFYDECEIKGCNGMDMESLLPIIEDMFDVKFPPNYSLLEDFVNRFEKNNLIWSIVEELKEKYRVGLLTNMYPGMLDLIKREGLLPKVEWDVEVDSSLVGFQKPDKKFYSFAQKKSGVDAGEILFVENSKGHIEAAQKSGWETVHYDPTQIDKSNKKLRRLAL